MGSCFSSDQQQQQGDPIPRVASHSSNKESPRAEGSTSAKPSSQPQPLPTSFDQDPSASSSADGREQQQQQQQQRLADAAAIGVSTDSRLHVFSFQDLKVATGGFRKDSKLGEGGFGSVFKGWVQEGEKAAKEAVAVKVLNTEGLQGHKEWLAEVEFLGHLHHPNLVRLVGYCAEQEQRLLVYEYMSKGSLENHLFRRRAESASTLPWNVRMKIALGAATGLAYLHEEADRQVIYRDFKTSNVLLDDDFNAKLSDFGLAKDGPEGDKSHVSTRVMGTYGYAAPEYVMTGHLTCKSDVYSYGVVLLEMITGRRAMDKSRPVEEHNLVDWARPFFADKRRLFKLLDPRLEGMYSIKAAQRAAVLAQNCLHRDPKSRPLMSDVVKTLSILQDMTDMAVGYDPAALAGSPEKTPHNRQRGY